MKSNLVIVESPAKAKTIQKFLGDDFVVMSSFGHIRDLHDKNLSVDVSNDFKPEYIIPTDKKKLVSELKKAAAAAQIVWLASDEDREGEAISWHLCEALNLKKENTRRIAFHEITKTAILKAIENPREIDLALVDAQQARRVLDRLVGFELSPILWRKIQRGLSAGRVQSVALRLVTDREKEIMAFNSTAFYKVEAQFDAKGTAVKGLLDTKFVDIDSAREFLSDSIGAEFSVASIDKKQALRHPAAPFTTSTLQQEASRKLRMPVGITMRVAQSLYERGLITYMRTDSTNLSALALSSAKQYICDNYGEQYSHPRQFKTHSKGAQEAHEAIRPTYIANSDIEGTAQEMKLYQLIWKRTVASQMEDAKVLNTSIKISSNKRRELFAIQGSEVLFDGFLKLYMEGRDDEDSDEGQAILPAMNQGDMLGLKQMTADCKYTQAPYRYSEATLVKKLEELGIGRPSTYATVISTLTTARGYVVKGDKQGNKVDVRNLKLVGSKISESIKQEMVGAEKGKLLPAEIGMIVSDYLVDNFPKIVDYDFTANVEKEFDEVAEGKLKWNKVIGAFYGGFHSRIEDIKTNGGFAHSEREIGIDPADGKFIIARFGQFGPYVQKGDASEKQFASLERGQLIETITLEEAIALFKLPRTVGQIDGIDVIVTKGRFGPYIKYGDKNVSLKRGSDPMKVSLDECAALIAEQATAPAANTVIKEFSALGISVLNGRYGPYIKQGKTNYKIPKGVEAASLDEAACQKIIAEAKPSSRPRLATKKK